MQEPALDYLRHGQIPLFRLPVSLDAAGADSALLGVPHDAGTTYQPGARFAPYHVRRVSALVQSHHPVHGIDVFARLRCVDAGNVVFPPFDRAVMRAAVEAQVAALPALPFVVGGDHSVTLPILRAVAASRPVGMVHIDAHGDTGDDYMGSRFHHGAPFRRAVEEGLLDPKRVIQIGLRGTSTVAGSLWAFSEESGMRVMPMDEVQDKGWRWAVEEAIRVVGDGPTYLSYDIDSLDPVHAPGTGTPEAGGLTTIEALRIIRGLRGIDFVGGDLVEVSPPFDVGGITAFNGASILFEILCVVAAARRASARL